MKLLTPAVRLKWVHPIQDIVLVNEKKYANLV